MHATLQSSLRGQRAPPTPYHMRGLLAHLRQLGSCRSLVPNLGIHSRPSASQFRRWEPALLHTAAMLQKARQGAVRRCSWSRMISAAVAPCRALGQARWMLPPAAVAGLPAPNHGAPSFLLPSSHAGHSALPAGRAQPQHHADGGRQAAQPGQVGSVRPAVAALCMAASPNGCTSPVCAWV